MHQTVYDFSANTLDGHTQALEQYKGQVLLIVNTASRCGFTPQYAGLEALQQRFHAQGFTVLGFPCNQFGHQEPGNAADIKGFCQTHYGVSFPMFEKIDVNGKQAHPLYQFLKQHTRGFLGSGTVKWNFTKFLVDRTGQPVKRYAPTTRPEDIAAAIESLLAK